MGYRLRTIFIAALCSCVFALQSVGGEFANCFTKQLTVWVYHEGGQPQLADVQRAELEEILKTQTFKNPRRVGKGVTGSEIVEFDGGIRAIKKLSYPKHGVTAAAEVASFRLDHFFGGKLNIPVTVQRMIEGQEYSLQVWTEGAREFELGELPTKPAYLFFFDYLIDNTDRRVANLLLQKDEQASRVVGIDHGLGFRTEWVESKGIKTDRSWSQKVRHACEGFFGKISQSCVRRFILRSAPPREVYVQLKATSEETFRALFEGTISDREIEAFLTRRQKLIETIEEAIPLGFKLPE